MSVHIAMTRNVRPSREVLLSLLKKHGRDFAAIGAAVNRSPFTIAKHLCNDGLLHLLPRGRAGFAARKPRLGYGEAQPFSRDPWDLDWSKAPIAKRYGLRATNYFRSRRSLPLKVAR